LSVNSSAFKDGASAKSLWKRSALTSSLWRFIQKELVTLKRSMELIPVDWQNLS